MVDVKLYYNMFDKAPYGAFVCDEEGYIIFANEKACEITGYPIIEITGKRLGAVITDLSDDPESIIDFANIKNGIYQFEKQDATEGFLSLHCQVIKKDVYVIYTNEYTQTLKLEQEVQRYIRRLEIAEKSGKSGSWELDIEAGIVWASNETLKLFRADDNDNSIELNKLLKYTADTDRIHRTINEVVKSGKSAEIDIEIKKGAAGNPSILHVSGTPIIGERGARIIIGAVSDITERVKVEKLLMEERNKFQQYIDIAGFIVIVLDETGRVRLANRKCCELLGVSEKDIIGKVWIDEFIPHDLRETIEETIRREMVDGKQNRIEHINPIVTAKGDVRYIQWNNSTVYGSKGEITGILSAGEDITDKLRIEKALAESEKSLREAELITKSGHYSRDLISGECKWSEGMYALFGYENNEIDITGETERNFMTEDSFIRYEEAFHRAARGKGEFSVEIDTADREGRELVFLIKGVVEKKNGRPGKILGTCQDITARREHLDRIEHISYHDHLTGLYNRRFLEEEFARLDVKRNYPLSVIMADVNGLKLANDAFGHVEGDNILKNAAGILMDACREDDIIARVGGDEFMILLPGTSMEDTQNILKRILKSKFEEAKTRLPVSIALGCAVKTDSKQDMDDLFKVAEDSMYRNKLEEKSKHRSKAIKIITKTLFEISPWEKGHAERVSLLCQKIGKALNLTKKDLKELASAGFFHDIGKVTIREDILIKKQSLTKEETENLNRHPETGYRILSSSNDTADLADYVLHHHENWNGSGYPQGLSNIKIPLQSRIIAIAESYDYLTNKPNNRHSYSKRRAFAEIRKNSGKQFDPEIIRIFTSEVFPGL
ncbi:MAG: diguanylate cyclase [Clostridia bacterium]|nr:diguanylate cyclase [Clostridia bacterium]